MPGHIRRTVRAGIFLLVALATSSLLLAQEGPPDTGVECEPEALARQQEAIAEEYLLDFESDTENALAGVFRLGGAYQELALRCGYQPTDEELNAMIEQVLSLTDISTILAAKAVGTDVDAILAELENVSGDSFNGQLLYNGMEPVLDGTALGCTGCHNGVTAPSTEGTWTRAAEVRLSDTALADYTVRRYLVESIVEPDAYIAPDYLPGLMPNFYGSKLDIQQLADIVAYLESQDQLLEEE